MAIIAEGLVRIPERIFDRFPIGLRRGFAIFVVIGVVLSMGSQGMQYVYAADSSKEAQQASKEARRLEREFTDNLFLFAENDPMQTAQFLSRHQYLAGYRAFRNKDYDSAEVNFRKSIGKSEFIAESHYLLAYIALLEHENGKGDELAPVRTEVAAAIGADPDYNKPYYLRAIVELKDGNSAAALDDIDKVAMSENDTCYDIHQPHEIAAWWQSIENDPRFKQIQARCSAQWGLITHT